MCARFREDRKIWNYGEMAHVTGNFRADRSYHSSCVNRVAHVQHYQAGRAIQPAEKLVPWYSYTLVVFFGKNGGGGFFYTALHFEERWFRMGAGRRFQRTAETQPRIAVKRFFNGRAARIELVIPIP